MTIVLIKRHSQNGKLKVVALTVLVDDASGPVVSGIVRLRLAEPGFRWGYVWITSCPHLLLK